MNPLSLKQLMRVTGAKLLRGDGRSIVNGFFTDSRAGARTAGEIFVPLRGESFDGHDFIGDVARDEKALGTFVEPEKSAQALGRTQEREGFLLLEVPSALGALQEVAAYNRAQYDIPVAGVTGSVGKTTTKEMIGSVLRLVHSTVMSEASFNNHIGVPLTLLKLEEGSRACVVEMGMNAEGEISRLSKIARPTVAAVTNVGPCHLERLKTVENVAAAKAEILDGMEPGAAIVLNADDAVSQKIIAPRARERGMQVVTFGTGKGADFRVETRSGDSMAVFSERLSAPVETRLALPGAHQALNAACAAAVCALLGISPALIAKGLAAAGGAKMRWEKQEAAGRTFILDCYNANPMSVKAGVETLALHKGRRIFVFGNMYELGQGSAKLHEEVGQLIAAKGLEAVLLVGELAAGAAGPLAKAGYGPERCVLCRGNAEASEALRRISREGDVIYLKGSRRNRMEEIYRLYTGAAEKTK